MSLMLFNHQINPIIDSNRITKIDSSRLHPHPNNIHFNSSIIKYRGRLIMAYRCGNWNARIHIAELDNKLQPTHSTEIVLNHPSCTESQEDPRLFMYNNKLHMSFAGLRKTDGNIDCHIVLAELDYDFKATKIWYPHFQQRTPIEKNWVFFEHNNELFCVYATIPKHIILHITDTASVAYETPTNSDWIGFVRGGASPVLHNNEYYHFFHGWDNRGDHYTYSIGVLTFEAKPPFRVKRISPIPIQLPDDTLKPNDPTLVNKSAIFPCGAIYHDNQWLISYGHHDHWCEISRFTTDEIERTMVRT